MYRIETCISTHYATTLALACMFAKIAKPATVYNVKTGRKVCRYRLDGSRVWNTKER